MVRGLVLQEMKPNWLQSGNLTICYLGSYHTKDFNVWCIFIWRNCFKRILELLQSAIISKYVAAGIVSCIFPINSRNKAWTINSCGMILAYISIGALLTQLGNRLRAPNHVLYSEIFICGFVSLFHIVTVFKGACAQSKPLPLLSCSAITSQQCKFYLVYGL